jgi:hypothetical protein
MIRAGGGNKDTEKALMEKGVSFLTARLPP